MTVQNAANLKINRRTASYWREILFWLLLVPALQALGSTSPRREVAGGIEACGFFLVACASLGELKALGLAFIEWNRVRRTAIAACMLAGFVAGGAIIAVANLSSQRIGAESEWNRAVLAITLGPISEEIVFRGYILTAAIWLTRQISESRAAALSILCTAVLFSLAHVGTRGITGLQLSCAAMTGCLYGWVRVHYCSTAAAAVTHGMYNLALYLGFWCGFTRS